MSNYSNRNYSNNNIQLKIPYNFVPLSKWVFRPFWAKYVSQDLPLPEESFCGIIEYSLRNETELCVGSYKDSIGSQTVTFEKTPDEQERYVIPGSSIKGMLREVLSIISFGKFNQIYNKRHTFRDLNNTNYKNEYGNYDPQPLWLKFDSKKGQWTIRKCKWIKVGNSDLKKFLKPGESVDNSSKISVIQKYKSLPLSQTFFVKIPNAKSRYVTDIKKNPDDKSFKSGHVVFSGYRIEKYKDKREDYNYSYFFYDDEELVVPLKDSKILIEITNLLNYDPTDKSTQKELITYLQKNQSEFGIPLWGLYNKNNNELEHLGTTRMPRIICQHSVHDLLLMRSPLHLNDDFYDLPEIMFGTIRDDEPQRGLKSRVCFSDAYSEGDVRTKSEYMVLAEPKSSFANTYLTDYVNDSSSLSYNENSRGISLSGWKRYIIRNQFYYQGESSDNANIKCTVNFVEPQCKFKGKILFHNLNSFELGALLWVIQFGENTKSNCCHSLGHAKPYGAGAVKIDINSIKFPSYNDSTSGSKSLSGEKLKEFLTKHINKFKDVISKEYSNYFGDQFHWEDSPQLKWLQFLAGGSCCFPNYDGKVYNSLTEFKYVKQSKKILKHAFEIFKNSPPARKEPHKSVDQVKINHSPTWDNFNAQLVEYQKFLNKDPNNIQYQTNFKNLYIDVLTKWISKDEPFDNDVYSLVANHAFEHHHHEEGNVTGFLFKKPDNSKVRKKPKLLENYNLICNHFKNFVEEFRDK